MFQASLLPFIDSAHFIFGIKEGFLQEECSGYMTVAALSGKGGRGKNTAAAFIDFSQARTFADCEADAPNLHLVGGDWGEPECFDYLGSQKASVAPALCVGCGACQAVCRFAGLTPGTSRVIGPYPCEGCGVCVNKWDTSPEKTEEIERFCEENSIPYAAGFPMPRKPPPPSTREKHRGGGLFRFPCAAAGI